MDWLRQTTCLASVDVDNYGCTAYIVRMISVGESILLPAPLALGCIGNTFAVVVAPPTDSLQNRPVTKLRIPLLVGFSP